MAYPMQVVFHRSKGDNLEGSEHLIGKKVDTFVTEFGVHKL